MIRDLDRTIKELLTDELPINNGEIDVQFDQPTREWSARLTRPTVNFFLYDVRENNVLRQHNWEKAPLPSRRAAPGKVAQKRTPFRIDCFYMMTTWAAEPQDEHRLLSRSMLALLRHPILAQERLVGDMRNQPFKVQARLANHDRLTNPAEVWSSLDNELKPSISYVITVALDPWAPISGPAVRTLTLHTGQSEAPANNGTLIAVPAASHIVIGGAVTDGGEPVPNARVAIRGTGWISATDDDGHFKFAGVAPGEYTLVVWPPTDGAPGEPLERSISVPQGEYDVSL